MTVLTNYTICVIIVKGDNMDGFAKRIKELRIKKGYTQAQLGEKLGISPSAVGMYEQGRRQPDSRIIHIAAINFVSIKIFAFPNVVFHYVFLTLYVFICYWLPLLQESER